MFAKIIALTGLVSVASAHIKLTSPVPFAGANNSPLEADGSNFPCKAVAYNADGIDNTFAQGSTQQLSFKGTAVHGGGSCQVSVTTDLNPTKDSVWKVIKSIEGGCPAQDTPGNMGNDAEADVPYKYGFDIPEDLAAGQYVLAWSWFNKVGNREMYMECAPITVTGSASDSSFFNTLPDMFVANVGNGCSTPDSTDLQFPNPGAFVEQLNGATSAFAAPVGSCPTGSSGGGSGGSPAPAPTATASPTSESNAQPTIPGGVFITAPAAGTTEAPVAPAPTSAPVVEAPVEAPVEQPVETPETPVEAPVEAPVETPVETPSILPAPIAAPIAAPSGGFASGTACSNEGEWNCVNGTSFQRCGSGVWSTLQQLAAGTACTAGTGANINFTKRSGGFTHRAMHRALRVKA
jgi:hypothetical protein